MRRRFVRLFVDPLELRRVPAATRFSIVVGPNQTTVAQNDRPSSTSPRTAIANFRGTTGDDVFSVQLTPGKQATLSLDGRGGNDVVKVYTSARTDRIDLKMQQGRIASTDYDVTLRGFATMIVYASADDTAWLYGTPQNDLFVAGSKDYAYLRSATMCNQVVGAKTVYARSGGGNDAAYLEDTTDDDRVVYTDTFSSIRSTRRLVSVDVGFKHQSAASTHGGFDAVWAYGSSGRDQVVFSPASGGAVADATNAKQFRGFRDVQLRLDRSDSVSFVGGGGGEVFSECLGYTTFADWNRTWVVRAEGMGTLAVDGGGGLNLLAPRPGRNYALTTTRVQTVDQLGLTGSYSDRLRQLALQLDPMLAAAPTPWDLAVRLRNHVFQNTLRERNSAAFWSKNVLQKYVDALVSQQEAVICDGSSVLYRDLLTAFGFKTRFIGLKAANNVDTHMLNEVQFDGRWIALDATFNAAFRDAKSGRLLSVSEMQARPKDFVVDGGGFATKRGRSLAEYYIPLTQLLAKVSYF